MNSDKSTEEIQEYIAEIDELRATNAATVAYHDAVFRRRYHDEGGAPLVGEGFPAAAAEFIDRHTWLGGAEDVPEAAVEFAKRMLSDCLRPLALQIRHIMGSPSFAESTLDDDMELFLRARRSSSVFDDMDEDPPKHFCGRVTGLECDVRVRLGNDWTVDGGPKKYALDYIDVRVKAGVAQPGAPREAK